jgi:alanyl-tRNA synthetase
VATVTEDLVSSKGIKAGALVGAVAKLTGGGGGGQPTLATAGGKQPEKLHEALNAVEAIIKSMM